MNDSGSYECVAKNIVGAAAAEITVAIAKHSRQSEEESQHSLLLMVVGAVAGGLVLVLVLVLLLVHRHHRHKNRKLATELSERTEEMNTLSRHESSRRLNSVSTDPRLQSDGYDLRVDSRIKSSQMSLERPVYKASQSSLSGRWGPAADGESSNMSLDSGLPSSLVPLKPQPEDSLGPREQDPESPTEEDGPPLEPDWSPPRSTPEEAEEGDSSSSNFQISEALTNHFYYSNGVLRPKPHSNAILLHPRGQVI
ncbi:hypothetical protein NHX12_003952 [Muraenolepis orangiensis]|uniref:Ig-like domain-containing protein n=1 Tax=Muraenolepis orangiensis TaxID=630683 RepID=A0A9Q0DTJ4_9TELE|nr:hypothetical protein NHX12_003952 [Muraenolepis orangiensis]